MNGACLRRESFASPRVEAEVVLECSGGPRGDHLQEVLTRASYREIRCPDNSNLASRRCFRNTEFVT